MNHSDRVSYLAAVLGQHARNSFSTLLSPLGLTPQHFGVLRSIATEDGCTQQNAADSMDIRRNLMVRLVDDLEKAGLVVRGRHPVDRRAHALHLTPAGKKALDKGYRAVETVDAELLDQLPAERRKDFQESLHIVATGLGLSPAVFPENR